MKLPRSDVLEAPFTADRPGRARPPACSPSRCRRPSSPRRPPAQCWTVVGSVGGCGATTIAVELATRPGAPRARATRVALVDLNLVDGAAAAYLGRDRQHACWPRPRPRRSGSTRRCSTPSPCASATASTCWPPARSEGLHAGQPDRGLPDAGGRLPGLRLDRRRPAAPPAALDARRAGRLRRDAGGLRADRAGAAVGPRPRRRDRGRAAGAGRARGSSSTAWPAASSARRRRWPRPRRRCSARSTAASPPTGRRPPPRSTSAARSATTGPRSKIVRDVGRAGRSADSPAPAQPAARRA